MHDLVADVDLASRILANEHDCKSRGNAVLRADQIDLLFCFKIQSNSAFLAINIHCLFDSIRFIRLIG
ncbi:hypothetical protein D9M72_639810 [compost metagenome]